MNPDLDLTVSTEDARGAEVAALVARHLAHARAHTEPENVFALDASGLLEPDVTVYGARAGGELLAIGALRELDAESGEVKSMHTAVEARGRGIGERMVRHLIDEARARGYARLFLETGSQEAFAPARGLYAKVGFQPRGAFGDYADAPTSTFMELGLDAG